MGELEPISSGESAHSAETSLGNRLMNVFVSPAEVFDEIKVSPPKMANWLLPLTLVIIMGVIYTMVVFSQPGIIQGMKDAQEKKMQQQVDAGKMTRQQADQASVMMEKIMGPSTVKVFGIVGVLVAQPVALFLGGLVIWLLGKWMLGGNFDYMKSVEMLGLASMISLVDVMVRMLLAVIYGNVKIIPGPVLLMGHYDPANKLLAVLAAVDLLSLWTAAVVAIGLFRLTGASFLKAAMWCFGLWVVMTLVPALILSGR